MNSKVKVKWLGLAAVAVMTLALVVSLLAGDMRSEGAIPGDIIVGAGVQALVMVPAVADLYSGTSTPGDIVASALDACVQVNSTLRIGNATVMLYNNSALINSTNIVTGTSFPACVKVYMTEPAKSQTYYLNATLSNVSTSMMTSTNIYWNRPVYGATVAGYGGYVEVYGTTLNNTLAYKNLYYRDLRIVGFELNSTSASWLLLEEGRSGC